MKDVKGKTIAITGGATGIGFALAKRFGQEGAQIVIGEPRQVKLDEAVEALTALGIEARAQILNVTDPASMEAFADFGWEIFDSVDVLINNAGVSVGMSDMTKLPLERLQHLFNVNFFGVWHGAASFGRRFKAQGTPAAIYNLGSENSFFNAVPKSAAYIASKHAVRGLTEAMREDMPDFIEVGLICPGAVASDLTPEAIHGMIMNADDFADIVIEQIKAGEFYIVSHAFNIERITPIHREIEQAYAKYAPRYEGDEAQDVRTIMASFTKTTPDS